MKYIYTKHFLERIKERNINIEDVDLLLSNEIKTIIIPSKTDIEAILILGIVNGKGFTIIKNKNNNKLITIRRMHKDEEALFKEYKND